MLCVLGGRFLESHAVAFRLRAMLKLDHLGVLFEELGVEGKMFLCG